MTELQSKLAGTNGVVQWFCGEKDFTTFGTQLVAFGTSLVNFSRIVSADGAISEEAVSSASKLGLMMTDLQASLVPTGGVIQWFSGTKGLDTFGTQLTKFGQALVDFSALVSADGAISDEAIAAAAKAGLLMAEVQAAIPEDKAFDGKMSIDEFGKKIANFGKGIVGYSKEVVGVDNDAVSNSLTAAKLLVAIAKSVVSLDTSGMELFKSLTSIGSTIKNYYTNISSVDFTSVDSSISSVRKLISMIKSMVGLDGSGIDAFKSAIANLATTDMSGFIKVFKDAEKFASIGMNIVKVIRDAMLYNGFLLTAAGVTLVDNFLFGILSTNFNITTTINTILTGMVTLITSKKEIFKALGVLLMTNFILGISSKSPIVTSTVTSIVSLAAISVRNQYSTFYSAGSYLVDGFAAGISENTYKAAAKASAMAAAAAAAAKAELDEHSPSKVGYEIGDFFGIGFVDGIGNQVTKAQYAGGNIANAAKEGLSNAINKVQDIISNGIDTQPTIRPVLDLSDVESGAGTISGLFNSRASVGVLSNVGAINTMVNNRNQNGANVDLISAIDKLRGDMSKMGNTYYTIDGITYSNGTEVSDAITSLTRAIKMEGRV